ncbi:hypothetical protein BJY01DRAFT_225909 [Aspergillus pseudoustus]|uniref:Letm1 RBD domain-containing protein n=1 Tax=Aspergillus pseudoustus TaxID=1810923 RepID=A0ABR4IX39_9EURO
MSSTSTKVKSGRNRFCTLHKSIVRIPGYLTERELAARYRNPPTRPSYVRRMHCFLALTKSQHSMERLGIVSPSQEYLRALSLGCYLLPVLSAVRCFNQFAALLWDEFRRESRHIWLRRSIIRGLVDTDLPHESQAINRTTRESIAGHIERAIAEPPAFALMTCQPHLPSPGNTRDHSNDRTRLVRRKRDPRG